MLSKERAQLILFTLCSIGLLTSVILKSRSFGLGFLICISLHLFVNHQQFRKKILVYGTLFLVLFLLFAFYLKYDSSQGRLLVYKISLNMWCQHPLGIGFGAFKRIYLDYQADYFKNGRYTQKELLLAGNTWYAFNDYFQIMLEGGAIGVLLVISYIIVVFQFIITYSNSTKSELPYAISLTAVITISTAALFNHVYERQWCQFILIFSFAILLIYSYRVIPKRLLPVFVIMICIMLTTSWELIKVDIVQRDAYQSFYESQKLARAGFYAESLEALKNNYHDLEDDPDYLDYYGQQLYYTGYFRQAIQVFKRSLSLRNLSYDYVLMGDCQYEVGNYTVAEQCYQKAIWMVPNRFKSRYALYLLYKGTNQTIKEISIARNIINLPVKIPSLQGD
jgi:tetratricopeptide (TPR) repeat protein